MLATLLCAVFLVAAPAWGQKKDDKGKGKGKGKGREIPLLGQTVNTTQAARDLAGGNVDAAVRAAQALGRDRTAAGLEALLDALALGVDPQVAIAALDALTQRPSTKSLDTLAHYGDHRNPKVRAGAVTALAAIDDRRVEKHILVALRDGHVSVRAAAAAGIARRKLADGVEPMMKLLVKGDEAVAPALAAMADPELAKNVAETVGTAPDAVVARCLGAMLMRPDFKPEGARVEVVRALARVPGQEALEQLTNYVSSIPENPPRPSRKEAESVIERRLGGK